jgi:DNA invertase Pin-like site-specific DNA recombinase
MDVIIAARLSQLGEGQEGIYSQDEDAQEWAEDNGHNVVATVADHKSGKYAMSERPNLKPWVTDPTLMARYQGIVAAKQDRLSREGFWDEIDLRKWAEANGKTLFIVSPFMQWPPDPDNYEDGVRRWNDGATDARAEWVRTSKRYKRMLKAKVARGSLTGRPTYGLQIIEATGEDGRPVKTLAPKPGEAEVIADAARRYLNGESVDAICADLNARQIPGPGYVMKNGKRTNTRTRWLTKTLAGLLRNPAIAGRRIDASGKTVLEYTGIISWQDHERIVARMDSRAHRKGISPGNVAMLTSVLFDEAGHTMTKILGGGPKVRIPYYYCRKCQGFMVRVDKADAEVESKLLEWHGKDPYLIQRLIPGENYGEAIARLIRTKDELDVLADDYDERHDAIVAEIRRLNALPAEPDKWELVEAEPRITIAKHWQALDQAGRRDWLKAHGWKVTAYADGRIVPTAGPVYR